MDKNYLTIIKKAQEGDIDAYEQLYKLCYKQAYHQAFALCKSESDAKDIAQESLLQVYKSLPQLRDLNYFNGWLARIVHSKCIRLFTHNRDALYDPELLSNSALPEKRIEYLPNMLTDDKTDKEIVHSLLKELTTKQQEIMELYYFQQLSLKEIESILKIPLGTIKSRIFEAKKALKIVMKDFEKREDRKISFHLDFIAPSFFMLFVAKLSNAKFFQSTQVLNTVGVVATTSCIALGAVAITQSYQVFANTSEPSSPLATEVLMHDEQIKFAPVYFKDKQITTPKGAYFSLKKQAVDDEELQKLSIQQVHDLSPLISSLKSHDTLYMENLVNNNWYNTYESLK